MCGSNKRGQLGLPDVEGHSNLPLNIAPVLDARVIQVQTLIPSAPLTNSLPSPPLLSNAQQVACGSHHTLALTEDGHVYAWGGNLLGQVRQKQTCAATAAV